MAIGNPMPGNVVPATRLDPVAVAVGNSLPLPNSGAGAATNFVYDAKLPASGAIVLDDATSANLFGNFLSIPYAPYLTSRSVGFKLYIDGSLIAWDKVTYSLPVPAPPAPAVTLKDITLAAASVVGGSPVQGLVVLTGLAPAGGMPVTLESDNAAASVPASVTVAVGQASATFTVTTKTVAAAAKAVVTAKVGTDSKTATLTVTPPPGIAGPFGMLFATIPAGEFVMGCSPGDTECNAVEMPPHGVKITRSFEMGKYEVTVAQWLAVMGTDPSYSKLADHPVEQVSWNEVQDFLAKLNARKDGYTYRLPTEAEWEYAARAGTTDKYAGGYLSQVACTDPYNTCIVGQLKPNAWGLYDMIGNVREYCQDWFADSYYATSPAVDPQGPANKTVAGRINRGGAWGIFAPNLLRVSSRSALLPDQINVIYGFRCVRQKTTP